MMIAITEHSWKRTRSSVVEREIPVSACFLKVIRSIRVGFTFSFRKLYMIFDNPILTVTEFYSRRIGYPQITSNQTLLAQRSRQIVRSRNKRNMALFKPKPIQGQSIYQ